MKDILPDEQKIIEKYLNKFNGGWYNIIDRYKINQNTVGILIKWGKENRQWTKLIRIRQ